MTSSYFDKDIPVLTDIITDDATDHDESVSVSRQTAMNLKIKEEALAKHLHAQLSTQIPVLIASALHERLPELINARLQTVLTKELADTLPDVAAKVTKELAAQLSMELSKQLNQNLEEEIKQVVTESGIKL